MHNKQTKLQAFSQLLDILDELRIKCPWDREQTNESLRIHTIEETYELCDALIRNNVLEIKMELGDVLLQIIFYSKIAEEKQQFDIADVCQSLCNKLIFRHPHVFGNIKIDNAIQVSQSWEQLKLKERGAKHTTILGGVPLSLPSLVKTYRIQSKVSNAGFDCGRKKDIWEKVRKKLTELENKIDQMDRNKIENEFGDLFFNLVNIARLYKINSDNALECINQKFISRFNYMEQKVRDQNKTLKDITYTEMKILWQEATGFYK